MQPNAARPVPTEQPLPTSPADGVQDGLDVKGMRKIHVILVTLLTGAMFNQWQLCEISSWLAAAGVVFL